MNIKEMREELIGKKINFIELDNEMMEYGYHTIFDVVSDFDELAESECVVYQEVGNEDEYTHIEFEVVSDFKEHYTEVQIKEIWVE